MDLIKFKATKNDEGRTLYKYLTKQLNDVSLSRIEKLFRLKDVKVNNKRTNQKNYLLVAGDEIWIYGIQSQKIDETIKTKINFNIIFEDKNILVIDKPIGVSIHGFYDSLDNQVLTYLNFQNKDSFKPASIGRLDKVTSGLIVYAKNYQTLVQMNAKSKYFEKFYLLKSDFPWEKQHVIFYGRKNSKTHEMDLFESKPGERMETVFFQERNQKYAKLITGKKHQIRLTLKKLNYPIYGDKKYGGKFDKRVYLHSYKVVFHNLENELEYLNDTSFICEIKW